MCRFHLVTNANPLKRDPTKTTSIQLAFMRELKKCFRNLQVAVRDFMVEQDALGLAEKKQNPFSSLLGNVEKRAYEFLTDANKVEAFNNWFAEQVKANVLSPDPGAPLTTPWMTEYVSSAYKRGLLNSYLSSKAGKLDIVGLGDQTADQFLASSFNTSEMMSKVALLGTRAFGTLKGVTDTMASQMNQILARGIADGNGPEEIAREMTQSIGSLTRSRAMTIARTELINAHAEGQLDGFTKLGVEELGVMAEWSTAGDDRVCPQCAPLEGRTFTVREARGMIPLHPNCRCSWIPALPKRVDKVKATQRPADPIGAMMKAVYDEAPITPEVTAWQQTVASSTSLLTRLDAQAKLDRYYRHRIFAGLKELNPSPSKPTSTAWMTAPMVKLPPVMKSFAAQADKFLKDVVHSSRLKPASIEKIRAGSRAYQTGNTIYVSNVSRAEIYVHEYAHCLQRDPLLMQAEKAFLKSRNPDMIITKRINGMSGEQGFVGDFFEKGGSNYTGRVYGLKKIDVVDAKTGKVRVDYDWHTGEVTTMGLQRLYENPAKFFRDDPEFFKWIVGQVQKPQKTTKP